LSLSAFMLAYLLDGLIGDPPRFPHPVRLLGAVIEGLEKISRRLFRSEAGLKAAGALIVIIAAGGSLLSALFLIELAYRIHYLAGWVLEIYILFTVLAGGDLRKHVAAVGRELQSGRLERAQSSVALLVSRDTGRLNESGVSRAALESLFENSADGLVAPLFFAALGGAPLAVLYKAVNTLDSMLGYITEEYRAIGFFSARLDDILSYIPSRLTAGLLILAGAAEGASRCGLKVLLKDRRKHSSPNSAWPEAAAAGVLGLKLGGSDYYCGRLKEQPLINAAGRDPVPADIERGLALFRRVSIMAFAFSLVIYYVLQTGEVFAF